MPLPDEERRRIRDEAENYSSTVLALIGFTAFVVHDGTKRRPDSHFGFGRTMDTSNGEVSGVKVSVTPDLVAQKTAEYGLVGEVKRSLPADNARWRAVLEQARKYASPLIGWWTTDERLDASDVTLLIHHSRSRAFVNYLTEERARDPNCIGTNTSIVEFSRSDEASSYFFFRIEWGGLRDAELSQRLTNGIQIPMSRVLATYPNIRFYDADPPLVMLATLLWTDYFAALAVDIEQDEKLKARPLDVSATAITDELQRAYGSQRLEHDERSAGFPTRKAVKRTLDALVGAKLAFARDADGYRIFFREFKDDVMQRLGELLLTPAEKVDERTMPLFAPPSTGE
jgi:hypothetical protein